MKNVINVINDSFALSTWVISHILEIIMWRFLLIPKKAWGKSI